MTGVWLSLSLRAAFFGGSSSKVMSFGLQGVEPGMSGNLHGQSCQQKYGSQQILDIGAIFYLTPIGGKETSVETFHNHELPWGHTISISVVWLCPWRKHRLESGRVTQPRRAEVAKGKGDSLSGSWNSPPSVLFTTCILEEPSVSHEQPAWRRGVSCKLSRAVGGRSGA